MSGKTRSGRGPGYGHGSFSGNDSGSDEENRKRADRFLEILDSYRSRADVVEFVMTHAELDRLRLILIDWRNEFVPQGEADDLTASIFQKFRVNS